jgi:hypothetical protein
VNGRHARDADGGGPSRQGAGGDLASTASDAYTIVGTATDLADDLNPRSSRFSGGCDFTRIAASDPVMWRDSSSPIARRFGIAALTEDLTEQRAIRGGGGDVELASARRAIWRSIIKPTGLSVCDVPCCRHDEAVDGGVDSPARGAW